MSGHTPPEPPDGNDPSSSIAREFGALIQGGREILYACGWDGRRYAGFRPGGVEVLKFCRRTEALVKRVLGGDHADHRKLVALAADPHAARYGFFVHEYVRVLERASAVHERNRVFDASETMFDALSSDCIEVAEALLNAGCHASAAKRAGVILEDTLRRIGRACAIDVDAFAAGELNDALRDQRAYDGGIHRRVAACLQIARDARPSPHPPIPDAELDEMVRWVRAFASEHRLLRPDTQHSRP